MDDSEWMYMGRSSQGSLIDERIEKTDAFLELAFARVKGTRGTWCPCSICANTRRQTKVVMGKHLYKNGFTSNEGKATFDVAYNPEDPPSAYSNESIHSRLDGCTSMARVVHGPEYDPSAHDLDGEVVMRAGGGKKHGRFWIGDGTIDTASTPTLPRFEHGARVPVRRYAHGRTLHGSR